MPKKADSETKILEVLALNREPLNLYKIEKAAGLKHATAYKALHKLLRDNLLTKVQTAKFRTGLETTTYTLTFNGLLAALTVCSSLWQQLDRVAEAHKNTFIIFQKWRVFEGCKSDVVASLQHAVKSLYAFGRFWLGMFKQRLPLNADAVASDVLGLYIMGVDPQNWQPKINYTAIWQACKKDIELAKFVEAQLKLQTEMIEEETTRLSVARQLWASL
jgi:DNA-binding PadR family transcriptional regulator